MSLWFPRLASERVLRACPHDGAFALTFNEKNANRLYCLNGQAEAQGLYRGMSYSDARAFCPSLQSIPADFRADQRFLEILRRWATRYCPWVGFEGVNGLVLDITGSAHLMGGEEAMLIDISARLNRTGLSVRMGLGDTRGAAWALAHHGEEGKQIAKAGEGLESLAMLPVSALRLDEETCVTLQRLGLRHIGDLSEADRGPLSRRFGPRLLQRLDQALGWQPEPVTPLEDPVHYGVRMTLPEPIGLLSDVMAGTERLLERLCDKLKKQDAGVKELCLTARRVDQESQQATLRLARPLRDPHRILPLFERSLSEIEAGFGIDQLRLQAVHVEALPSQQTSYLSSGCKDQLDDLITRLGTRIGLENIQRFLPADSHIPERSFSIAPAAFSEPDSKWRAPRPRPIRLFGPDPIEGGDAHPPRRFRWRGLFLTARNCVGPERITPEWWQQDGNWSSGLRDYWQVETAEGRRLWMFYTPQEPGWFVQGEFA